MINPLIEIDAGHGGSDPGASANGIVEKVYTLMFSLYQYRRFRELGVPALLTRDSDTSLGNVNRASKIKNSGVKYCISNHLNAATKTSAQGVEVIHSIYNDGKLAKYIVEALANEGIPKRAMPVYSKALPSNTKQDYYYIHRWTGSVQVNIIEYDFITNSQGAKRVKENWERYAEAVVRVYCNFLGYQYKPPKIEDDVIMEWAKKQGYDINIADDKITYKELWTILYQLQGGELPTNKEELEVIEMARPILKKGSTGSHVRILQSLLKVDVDGIFGSKTESAVRDYQSRFNLMVDGIVGAKTWNLLLLSPSIPVEKPNAQDKYKYYVEGTTHIVEINPLDLKLIHGPIRGIDVKEKNYINASFVWWGDSAKTKPYPTSMLVYDGKIIHNGQPNGFWSGQYKGKGVPTPTLIIYKDGRVVIKDTNDLSKEAKDIHLAVAVVECYPSVRQQGFAPYVAFSSVAYSTNRVGIAYRKKDNKVLLIYRPATDINRFNQTMKNLGCDFGGSMDSGGSANFIINSKKISATTRWMYAGITF